MVPALIFFMATVNNVQSVLVCLLVYFVDKEEVERVVLI
jgi:hypothetical protein